MAVLDATYNYEVWNQPVVAYEVVLFNPESKVVARNIEKATVDKADFHSDFFKSYRSERAQKFIGVSLRLTYVIESRPNHDVTDSPENDLLRTVHYVYDLKLDDKMNIIGGEWYQNAHPDFIWTPHAGARAKSVADIELFEKWTSGLPPKSWSQSSKMAAFHGQPLAGVVERLIELSQPTR
jgi:hypothetical protein